MDERQRQVEPALHPARVAADPPVGRVGQADPLEQRVRPAFAIGLREALQRRLETQMLTAGEDRVQRGLLQRRADRSPYRAPLLDDVIAADARGAAGRRSSVVSISTVVDLPAPFGPRKP